MTGRDVRMRGFRQRTPFVEAIAWIDAHTNALDAERIAVPEATTRILAEAVRSPIAVPRFDRSAMDGYAVIGEETAGASTYNPLPFRVVGTALPGQPCTVGVRPGCCVRIMTGAPIPEGATAVVPVEQTGLPEGTMTDADGVPATIEVTEPVPPLKHIGRFGEDVAEGASILEPGRRLRPQDIGLCAAVGCAEVSVVRRPRVRIITTGNELRSLGEDLTDPHQIYDSNTPMLRSLIERDGGTVESTIHVRDDIDSIREAMTEPGADLLLISGGSSVGAEDHAPALLASEGDLAIHGIAMRPSSPAGMGTLNGPLVFLLPGNPVSCLCAYDTLAGRALRRLAGGAGDWSYSPLTLPLGRKIVSAIGRVDYCRLAIDTTSETQPLAVPLAISGASILSSTTRAVGFTLIDAPLEGIAAGEAVSMWLY